MSTDSNYNPEEAPLHQWSEMVQSLIDLMVGVIASLQLLQQDKIELNPIGLACFKFIIQCRYNLHIYLTKKLHWAWLAGLVAWHLPARMLLRLPKQILLKGEVSDEMQN